MALLASNFAAHGEAPQAFDLQAHRGGRGLAPENTLAAFGNAMALGVTTLELDIGLTADNVVVISHDTALNPDHTRDANGRWLSKTGPTIHSMTLAQVQAYDVGRLNPGSDYGKPFAGRSPAMANASRRWLRSSHWHASAAPTRSASISRPRSIRPGPTKPPRPKPWCAHCSPRSTRPAWPGA